MTEKPTVVPFGVKDEYQAAIDTVKRELPKLIEHAALMSKIKRTYFLALVNEGFTEAQALELCKHPIAP